MRKATLVLATSVAFLVSGAAFAATGSRTAPITSAADLIMRGSVTDSAGNLRVQSEPISGVYLPAGSSASQEVAVPLRTAGTVAKSAVSTAMRTAIRANAAAAAASLAIDTATSAVGWMMKDGAYVKKTSSSGADPDNGKYYWTVAGQNASTPQAACDKYISGRPDLFESCSISSITDSTAVVQVKWLSGRVSNDSAVRNETGCSTGGNYNYGSGKCDYPNLSYAPLSDSDFNDLGDWVQQQDGTFVRQAAIDSCSLAVNPEACFQTLVPDRQISGPATVTGSPTTTSKTVTTLNPDGTTTTGTSTTTTTPGASVTYNNNTTNNITYNTYDKTVTKNPDGSITETSSDEGPPNVPDLTSTAFGPLSGLPADIAATGATGSSLPFIAWFKMGGQCKEHIFQLPVVGALTTNYCPIHEAYVRPFLYFIFSVWTFIYCFQIWRESTVRVRIM